MIYRVQIQQTNHHRHQPQIHQWQQGTQHLNQDYQLLAMPREQLLPQFLQSRRSQEEQFLQQLRVLLDRESQNDNTTVQWSTDGSSFIIMDQHEFEELIIPTCFDNPIVFSSFLSKLDELFQVNEPTATSLVCQLSKGWVLTTPQPPPPLPPILK